MNQYVYSIVGWRNNDIPKIIQRANTAIAAEELREQIVSNLQDHDDVYDVTVESGDFDPTIWG